MIDGYQRAALSSRLGIPILYGVDAVHGHGNVHGATVFPHNIGLGATRDPQLVEEIARATAEELAGTGVRWNFAPVRRGGAGRALGPDVRELRRGARDRRVVQHVRDGAAGRHARRRAGVRPRDGEALDRGRRHDRRRGGRRRPAQRGRAAGDPPAAVPGGDPGGRRVDHGRAQQRGRRADARRPAPRHRRAQGRARVRRPRRVGLGGHRRRLERLPAARCARSSTPASTW